MSRIKLEQDYWNKAALDPQVDEKYICDLPRQDFIKLLHSLGVDRNKKTLEIGCGVGRLMAPGFFGIDISENMLEIAKQRRPDCEFKLTDGREIPYPNETFDTVYCVLVFQHLPKEAVDGYIREAHRVLRYGGNLVFQYIQGTEDAPFSKGHFPDTSSFKAIERNEALIHPSWTWIKAIK